MKMKYIIFDSDGIEVPILFPEIIQHVDIAAKLYRMKPVSAGFVQTTPVGLLAYGYSTSLHLESRLEDSKIINSFIEFNEHITKI